MPDAGDPVNPCEDVGELERLDRLINRVAIASGARGDGFVAREASTVPAVVEAPQQRLQHLHVSARDRSPVLAGLLHAGVVALRIGDDPRLGVAVERNPARFAKDFSRQGRRWQGRAVAKDMASPFGFKEPAGRGETI